MLPKSLDTLRIDINSGKVRKAVSVCQNDSIQRTLNILLVNSGTILDLTNVLFAEILIKKADGFEADNGCVIDGESIQYTLRTTDISALGINQAQLQLTFMDGQVITTPPFEINVYSKVLDQNVQKSSNEYTALTEQLVRVTELANQTNSAKDVAVTTASEIESQASEATNQAVLASEYADSASLYASEAYDAAENATSEATYLFNSTFIGLASTAGDFATSASLYASEANSEAEITSTYLYSTSEYLSSASNYASIASSEAAIAFGYMTSTSGYLESTIDYASTAESQVNTGSTYLISTSEYAETASSEANIATSQANAAELAKEDALDYAERAEEAYRKMGEETLVLGETASTAYRGDRGKIAYDHSQTVGNPHNTTPADIGADAEGAAALAYTQAAGYIDQRIADLINGAPQTLDTLKEIADAMADDHTVIEALQAAIGSKAAEADFQGHATNSTIHITAAERTLWNGITALTQRVTDLESMIGYPINPS